MHTNRTQPVRHAPEPPAPPLGPVETFAEALQQLFDEVNWHGYSTLYHQMATANGVQLYIRREPFQQDPSTVYVSFRSGRLGIWCRFTASGLTNSGAPIERYARSANEGEAS